MVLKKSLILTLISILILFQSCEKSGEEGERTGAAGLKLKVSELIKTYNSNKENADKKYKGQKIEVTGFVKKVAQEVHRIYIILCATEKLKSDPVKCYVSDEQKTKATQQRKGTVITVCGMCEGLEDGKIIIRECSIAEAVEKKRK